MAPDARAAFASVFEGRAHGLLIEFDQAATAVASVLLPLDGAPRAVCALGAPLGSLVDGEAREAVAAGLIAVRRGEQHDAELKRDLVGGPVWLRLMMLPRYKGHGRQRGFSLAAMNVTGPRRGAAELAAARERLAAILNNAADGVILLDGQGRIEDANAAAAAIFGWPRDELLGEPVERLMDEPYRSFHAERLAAYLAGGPSGILNVGPRLLPGRRRDGSLVSIELSVGEASIGGERKFVGVCREAGERLRRQEELNQANAALAARIAELQALSDELMSRKQASDDLAAATEAARREAEAASLAKSRFLAKASHELRTPLNGVLAVADLLRGHDLPAEAQELAGVIARSARDLVGLLNEVLDLASLEAGGVTLRPAPFSLAELLGRVAEVWSAAAADKGLDFAFTGPARDERLLGDAVRLTQVLSNLLNNAVKFTVVGEASLAVEVTGRDAVGVALRFTVADTGPGIEDAVRARLFEPFAETASLAAGGGAGLGLSICRELVELMGGTIRAESAHRGTRFVVELELPAVHPEREADIEAVAPPVGLEGLRALVAEDHPVNRQVMGLLLEQLGVAHEFAEDGEAAVSAAASGRFGLVLMDLQMPRLDGLGAAAAIRRLGGEAGSMPIVAVSAHADLSSERLAHFDGAIAKPITLEAVARAIEAAVATPSRRRF